MVTSKTVTNIGSLASRLDAISDYLYENGMAAESDELRLVSNAASKVAHSIQEKIIRYEQAVLKEE